MMEPRATFRLRVSGVSPLNISDLRRLLSKLGGEIISLEFAGRHHTEHYGHMAFAKLSHRPDWDLPTNSTMLYRFRGFDFKAEVEILNRQRGGICAESSTGADKAHTKASRQVGRATVTKVSEEPCRDFARGRCTRRTCKFSHHHYHHQQQQQQSQQQRGQRSEQQRRSSAEQQRRQQPHSADSSLSSSAGTAQAKAAEAKARRTGAHAADAKQQLLTGADGAADVGTPGSTATSTNDNGSADSKGTEATRGSDLLGGETADVALCHDLLHGGPCRDEEEWYRSTNSTRARKRARASRRGSPQQQSTAGHEQQQVVLMGTESGAEDGAHSDSSQSPSPARPSPRRRRSSDATSTPTKSKDLDGASSRA